MSTIIDAQPTDGLTYDPSEERYWDRALLHKEVVRVFDICNGCRMCFKYCDSFPLLFGLIDDDRHAGDVTRLSPNEKLSRAGIAYILQDKSVFPSMTVEENLWMGAYLMGGTAEARQAAERVFDKYPRLAARRRHPAKVLSGGSRIGNRGYYYPLTVLADLPDDARAMHEEPFGPLALVNRVKSLDEAIEKANALPFGLAGYAFTNAAKNVERLSEGAGAHQGQFSPDLSLFIDTFSRPDTPPQSVVRNASGQDAQALELLRVAQPGLQLVTFFLGALDRGYVAIDAEDAYLPPRFIVQGPPDRGDPFDLAGSGDQSKDLARHALAAIEPLVEGGHACGIVGMEPRHEPTVEIGP